VEALLGYKPDFRINLNLDLDLEDELPRGVPAAKDRIEKLHQLRQTLRDHWAEAVETQQRNYNQKHKPIQFKKGDLVGLSTRHLRFKGSSRKLAPRFIGPFRILERIGQQAYRLALPNKYAQLHNVFPVQLLEPWSIRAGEDILPMPDLDDEDPEWEVEEVKAKQVFKGITYYLVKWAGWPTEYNQWIPADDMTNCQRLISQFEKTRKDTGGQKARRQAEGKT
jgi:hypothetical protein